MFLWIYGGIALLLFATIMFTSRNDYIDDGDHIFFLVFAALWPLTIIAVTTMYHFEKWRDEFVVKMRPTLNKISEDQSCIKTMNKETVDDCLLLLKYECIHNHVVIGFDIDLIILKLEDRLRYIEVSKAFEDSVLKE